MIGTDIKKAQLFLAKVDLTANNVPKVLESLEKCPLYLNCFLTSGRHNMTCLLIGENMRSIMSCVDSHIRPDPLIKEMEFNLVVTPIRDFIVPLNPVLEKKESTPCKTDCSDCTLFANNRCLGCPASIDYKGSLL